MRSFSLKEAVHHSKRLQELGVFGKRSVSFDQENTAEHNYTDAAEDDVHAPSENLSIQEQCLTETDGVSPPQRKLPADKTSNDPGLLGPTLRPKKVRPVLPPTTSEKSENQGLFNSNFAEGPATAVNPVEPKRPPFGERYKRITTYLEAPLFLRIHDLHRRGEIAKIASLLNAAVRDYLDRHYPSK